MNILIIFFFFFVLWGNVAVYVIFLISRFWKQQQHRNEQNALIKSGAVVNMFTLSSVFLPILIFFQVFILFYIKSMEKIYSKSKKIMTSLFPIINNRPPRQYYSIILHCFFTHDVSGGSNSGLGDDVSFSITRVNKEFEPNINNNVNNTAESNWYYPFILIHLRSLEDNFRHSFKCSINNRYVYIHPVLGGLDFKNKTGVYFPHYQTIKMISIIWKRKYFGSQYWMWLSRSG